MPAKGFKPRKPGCGWGGGCPKPHGEDSYLCDEHALAVMPVTEAMRAEEDPYGTRGSRKKTAPQCTRPGCRNPRKNGQSMCADCAEESFWNGEEGSED